MKTIGVIVFSAFLVLGLAAQSALAYRGGDIIVRVGATTIDPTDVESDTLTLNGEKLPGTEVDKIDKDTQLGLTGVYMFTDYFGLELLAAHLERPALPCGLFQAGF